MQMSASDWYKMALVSKTTKCESQGDENANAGHDRRTKSIQRHEVPKPNGEDVCSGHEITETPHTVAHKHVSELAVDTRQVNQALEALHSDTSRFPQSKDQSQHLGSRNGFRQSHNDRLPSQRCNRGTRGCVHEAPRPLVPSQTGKRSLQEAKCFWHH